MIVLSKCPNVLLQMGVADICTKQFFAHTIGEDRLDRIGAPIQIAGHGAPAHARSVPRSILSISVP